MVAAGRPILETITFDHEGIAIWKIDDFLALRFMQFTLLRPISIQPA
jgi:hypothetical protein